MDPEFLKTDAEHQHDLSVTSCSWAIKGELLHMKLQQWIGKFIREKAVDYFRYKGVCAVKGMDRKFVFQGVHMLFSGGFDKSVAKWQEG